MTCKKTGLVALLLFSIPACTHSRYQIVQTEFVHPSSGNVNGKMAILLDTQTGETWQEVAGIAATDGQYEWKRMPRSEQKP